ncbi:MAG: hypothetical protein EG826_01080 [Deltaproteobacteria bacterium]|nr:hypothetical protein [Deltaproteobacteria bacterium]
MKIKEESSFLQGVESRLDSLFAEDVQPLVEKDSDPPAAAVQDLPPAAPVVMEETQEIPAIVEKGRKSDVPSEPVPAQDKSSFISEIEKRFSAIFGEDDAGVKAAAGTAAGDALESISAPSEREETLSAGPSLEDVSSPSSSVLHSPLKDMKSIILSIEWEINDTILEQLEDEINKLYLMYTGDRVIQGFLRILRFLGRYVRVRGVHSTQDSINLLLYIYDHLESVMVSEGMTEAKKHAIISDSIKRYRAWVESIDLEAPSREIPVQESEPAPDEPPIPEPSKEQVSQEWKADEEPLTGIRSSAEPIGDVSQKPIAGVSLEPVADVPLEKAVEEPLPGFSAQKEEQAFPEPEVVSLAPPAAVLETAPPAGAADIEKAVAAIKDLPPHEAFIYAVEEMKRMFQSELDALKEEVRILKNAR